MDVSEGSPRVDASRRVSDDTPSGQRDRESEIEGAEGDETPVAAVTQVRFCGDERSRFLSSLQQGVDCEGPITSRDECDEERPRVDENESERGVVGRSSASVVLENVESMGSSDVFQRQLQYGKANCDQQIENDPIAFLSFGD